MVATKRDVGEEVYRGQELEQKQKNKENKGERNLVFTPNQPVRLYQGKERERERLTLFSLKPDSLAEESHIGKEEKVV